MEMSETRIIQRINRCVPGKTGKGLLLGIGDDCAVVFKDRSAYCILTTDTFNEEVHFSRKARAFFNAGVKAASAGISDIYAMAGKCLYVLVSVSAPGNMTSRQLLDFYRGVKSVLRYTGARLAGGDTTASRRYFSATITAVGEVAKKDLKLRSGARPGDRVFLTDMPGLSLAGLTLLKRRVRPRSKLMRAAVEKHLAPLPKKDFRRYAGDLKKVTAMIDISDGLSTEAAHIARRSGVRMVLDEKALLSDPRITVLARALRIRPLDLVLQSGEEYGLLFTAHRSHRAGRAVEIGRVEKGRPAVYLASGSGRRFISPSGYDHFIQSSALL
jgi:thiamine-monophosphate kinase